MMLARWSVEWSNPYTQPPRGLPRVLAEWIQPHTGVASACPEPLTQLHRALGLGSGWGVHFRPAALEPIKSWSPERKARDRRRRLEARIRAQAPMFAESLISQELAARPEYFAAAGPQRGDL